MMPVPKNKNCRWVSKGLIVQIGESDTAWEDEASGAVCRRALQRDDEINGAVRGVALYIRGLTSESVLRENGTEVAL